ncbi:AAA family ATPase [Paenibacillus ferrarius]|uniref:AAA family ATPase n=1 Tax=Paenibacillus ferrarius TaxID=1469647 RepID=UPI003D2CA4B0
MIITNIALKKFKRVEHAEFNLEKVNVIVGGNNAGKSSILQGIHFSVTVSAIARQQQLETFSSDLLIYNPTSDFTLLKNGTPYRNFGDDISSELSILGKSNDQAPVVSYNISLDKGRNHGNIGCRRSGDYTSLGTIVTDPSNLFSIYVPGLAGIPQSEELKSKAIVRRGVASGDANLYLRNIIYYISKINKLTQLNESLRSIFAGMYITVSFNEENDTSIKVFVNLEGRSTPLELIGTGVLQIIQILSYITYFSPKILLLDEPDSHLHPNNQIILAETLTKIAEESNTQILLCTHSRHMIEALYGQANFIWMKNGSVEQEGPTIDRLPLLVDIGALDDFDKFRQGTLQAIILTEDRNTEYLEQLLNANGFDLTKILIYSYKTSSNLEQASLFVEFIKEVSNNCDVIIHRDLDFMLEDEISKVRQKITEAGAIPFITRGSDIEAYYINPIHLAELLNEDLEVVESWIHELAIKHHNEIQHQYTRKRDEIKNNLYRSTPSRFPDTLSLIGSDYPLPEDKRKGKFMIKKIRGDMYNKFSKEIDIITSTTHLVCSELEAIKHVITQPILENVVS